MLTRFKQQVKLVSVNMRPPIRTYASANIQFLIIMVPIWKCVSLTRIWSHFPDVHYFRTHLFLNYLLLFY